MGSMITVGDIDVYRAEPAGSPRGAVIVIEEIWGLNDQIKGVADRWAAEGYLALAPDILSEIGITPERGEELAALRHHPDEAVRNTAQPAMREAMAPVREPEYGAWAVGALEALVDVALAEPGIEGKVGVTGFCFGGTFSFALAAADDRVLAAVPFYGTAPEPARLAQIACPVLALYGVEDEALMGRLPEVREAAKAAGIDFTDVVYPGAGHAFFNEQNAISYRPEVAADAWAKAAAFIAEHVG